MNVLTSLIAVILLALIPFIGIELIGLDVVLGIVIPYIALALFITGITLRILIWTKVPVPFNITTSCGQQKTLPWFKSSPLESPHNIFGVIGRMLLEILIFRSLLRNTSSEVKHNPGSGPKVVYRTSIWLWLGAMAFHWTFLIIVFRHLRFFTEPEFPLVGFIESFDGFLQIGSPIIFITGFIFLAALCYLFLRRIVIPQLRYISLGSDYFPLFLLIGIASTGLLMRYTAWKVDIISIKDLSIGLISFKPVLLQGSIGSIFYIHLFLVSILLAYFPFSKLMHMGGAFLSPTRNMPAASRKKRHANPWDYTVKVHSYEEYEDEFRDLMKEAGIPVEKE